MEGEGRETGRRGEGLVLTYTCRSTRSGIVVDCDGGLGDEQAERGGMEEGCGVHPSPLISIVASYHVIVHLLCSLFIYYCC